MNVVRAAFRDEFEEVGIIPTSREWFTTTELADLALPGLPADKRSFNRRARDERWHLRSDADGNPLSRPRTGRGGGTEFNVALLPGAARLELAKRGLTADMASAEVTSSASGWCWYDSQSSKTKAEAERRAGIVAEIELLEQSGLSRTSAIAESSRLHGIASATIWNWLRMVAGVGRSDRLPALAPRRQGGGAEAEIHPLIWTLFKSDFLRLEQPTLSSCYNRCAGVAAERGLQMPSEKTFRRRAKQEIDPSVLMLRRSGVEPLRRSIPSQRRTTVDMHAMELVNIDGHKFDVFVTPQGGGKPIRPMMVGIQDIHSRKFLAWRLDESENAVLTRLAFADLFKNFGIPKGCLMDNGRAFASKWISGGAKTRFRFKIKEEEPTGLLTGLGITIHWALPYRGQSKPIERAFRDMCDSISRGPKCAGAYVGNTPLAKPENYMSRAVPWDEFIEIVNEGIAAHNAKLGRRGANMRGRSFDEVFAESYASAPIGKASPEQLRMALLAAEQKTVDRRTGEIALFGNRYWSIGCGQLHGQRVTVRFDPDDLMNDIHLYGSDGRYLTNAGIIDDTGFRDAAGAKATQKRWADYRSRARAGAEAEQLMAAEEVAAMQVSTAMADLPEPAVLRPVRHRGQSVAAMKAMPVSAPTPNPQESRVFAALGLLKAVE